jgi:hypothetical protein
MEPFYLVIVVIIIGIVVRLVAGSFDGERVEKYVRDMGGEVLDRSWAPFGPGWFGEKDSRIYQIVYRDSEGRVHRAHVKTSMMSGVYLTNDQVIEEPEISVEEEKKQLRRRLRELESREGPERE